MEVEGMRLMYDMNPARQKILKLLQQDFLTDEELKELEGIALDLYWEADIDSFLRGIVREYGEFLSFIELLARKIKRIVRLEEGEDLHISVYDGEIVACVFLTIPILPKELENHSLIFYQADPLKRFVNKYLEFLRERSKRIDKVIVEKRLEELKREFAK